jgi:F-box protein 18 (helicase)
MFELTQEQKDIVSCDLLPGQILKVIAFAGTGKTSTLVEYAKDRPHMRFLYIAFNKSVQNEARKKFPSNVTAKTSHAIAFRSHGYMHQDRLVTSFKPSLVKEVLGLDSFEDSKYTIDTLYNYLVSKDPKVSKWHIPYETRIFYRQKQKAIPDFIYLANRLGRIMCDVSDKKIGMLHDGYLKLYQLSKPILNYDCILLDEAQDINPATSDFVLSQSQPDRKRKAASIILVGDSHQQIYSFRGAKDTLKKIESTNTMYLTRSFRFDNNVARVANLVLKNFKGEKRKLVGFPLNKETKPKWNSRHYTVIARTNAAIFDEAVQLYDSRKIGFVGGISGYRFSTIKDVYHLNSNNYHKIDNQFIKSFDSYRDLNRYAEDTEDYELFSVFKIVGKYKSRIPYLVSRIKEQAVDEKNAEVVLTTAHKSKGLEWNNIKILGDFPSFIEKGKIINPSSLESDEFNLVYVAMTRTKCRLIFDKESTMPKFIQKFQKLEKKSHKVT